MSIAPRVRNSVLSLATNLVLAFHSTRRIRKDETCLSYINTQVWKGGNLIREKIETI
jgi:hypothetical protein